jgi:hypothetical protein
LMKPTAWPASFTAKANMLSPKASDKTAAVPLWDRTGSSLKPRASRPHPVPAHAKRSRPNVWGGGKAACQATRLGNRLIAKLRRTCRTRGPDRTARIINPPPDSADEPRPPSTRKVNCGIHGAANDCAEPTASPQVALRQQSVAATSRSEPESSPALAQAQVGALLAP